MIQAPRKVCMAVRQGRLHHAVRGTLRADRRQAT